MNGVTKRVLPLGLLTTSLMASTAQAERINTSELVSRTTSAFLNCAEFELVGGCFWWRLKCGWRGCKLKVTMTPRIEHYVPDLTVQTYKNVTQTPVKEMDSVLSAAQADYNGGVISVILNALEAPVDELGSGNGSENGRFSHSNTTNNSVDIFGNPAASVIGSVGSFLGITCGTSLTPMYPYYISHLDTLAWRFGIPESLYPESLNPFANLLGDNLFNFGGIYPRMGSSSNHDELKDSALSAFRSAHFVTRSGESHVYTYPAQSRQVSKGIHDRPGAITMTSGKWQQISPAAEDSCHYMPYDMNINVTDGRNEYRSDDGGYVWNLWRPYSCCAKPGGWRYLTHF